jgi:mono/diheme cytochrome c family protein
MTLLFPLLSGGAQEGLCRSANKQVVSGWFLGLVIALIAVTLPSFAFAEDSDALDFQKDIRPILSDNCFRCHGPDAGERKAGLRLDEREVATGEAESGNIAIVPGKSDASELLVRVMSDDEFTQMPPPETGKYLSAEQIALLKRWIDEGANYSAHWSFEAAVRPEVPKSKFSAGAINPIDDFIRARLEENGLEPSAEATKTALIRRVTLDLTGLPPTPEEVDAFLADTSPEAYEKVVDRLLKSPRYGEHMARHWLDAARYGDTHGLHLDNERSIWPYREWVIRAYNENMPFDQFTEEQLAGDLLPNPTTDQLVATGFNRCNVTTSEGGSINEEYRVRYAVDRVETTATVWMGLTAGCAVCHDHKFDPLTQKEFYELFAFFANVTEKPMDGNALLPPPSVQVMTEGLKTEQSQLETDIAAIRKSIEESVAKVDYQDPGPAEESTERADYVWIEDDVPAGANAQGNSAWKWVTNPVHAGGRASQRTATGLSQHFFTDAAAPLVVGKDDVLFAYVFLDEKNPPKEIMLQFNDGVWDHRAYWGSNNIDWGANDTPARRHMGDLPELGKWVRLEVKADHVGLSPGSKINGWAFTQFDGTATWDHAGINTAAPQANQEFESLAAWESNVKSINYQGITDAAVVAALKKDIQARTEAEKTSIRTYFLTNIHPPTREQIRTMLTELKGKETRLAELTKQAPSTLVMKDRDNAKPEAYVLDRGMYDQRKEQVFPATPSFLPGMPETAPKNRLGLAQWLVDPSHPLTARVTVNRYWQRLFGVGIVKTSEDFGAQGNWPSHPQLLDWLAVEFQESGWDTKHMMKLMVMSATYRQSSHFTPDKMEKDPQNTLLARGPRYRLDAEVIRDSALFASGLLVEKLGGKSVKPYQPGNLWKIVAYSGSNTRDFKQDSGEALYRRSMYTFWKRTSPPVQMSTFDAPSRETCTVRRARTNSPLQALLLMNDDQYVEAARHLAARGMTEAGDSSATVVERAFRLVNGRVPTENEIKILLGLYEKQKERFKADPAAADKLLGVGASPRDETLDKVDHAAWTMVASLILNLDEAINKN